MKPMDKVFLWLPRILGILFVIFLSLFSLDIFDTVTGFWQITLGLLIHNAPGLILLALILLSWRMEWLAGTAFFLGGILYIVLAWGKFDWMAYAFISGPCFLEGILYWIAWRKRLRRR